MLTIEGDLFLFHSQPACASTVPAGMMGLVRDARKSGCAEPSEVEGQALASVIWFAAQELGGVTNE